MGLQFNIVMPAGIDDARILVCALRTEIEPVALMHMSMRHQAWAVLLHKLTEADKPLMAQVLVIAQLVCRRMCQQDIHALMPP